MKNRLSIRLTDGLKIATGVKAHGARLRGNRLRRWEALSIQLQGMTRSGRPVGTVLAFSWTPET